MQKSKFEKNPNPQGKGLVPVMDALESGHNGPSAPVPQEQVLGAYLSSRLVLCAQFQFKPVVGNEYYLYISKGALKLSLIGPSEWRENRLGHFVARCRLRAGMLWQVYDLQAGQVRAALKQFVASQRDHLLSDLASDQALAECLPECDARLPFHRRVLANGLARTVKASLGETEPKSLVEMLEEQGSSHWLLERQA